MMRSWHNGAAGGPAVLRAVVVAALLAMVSGCGGGGSGSAGTVTGTGAVTASIAPDTAVAAGARWTLDGDTGHASGETVSNVTAGNHTVAFTGVSGLAAPAAQTVTVTAGQTASASGTYAAAGSRLWTVMLYIDGDNDLENYALLNLDQLEQLPDNPQVTLVAVMKMLHGFPGTTNGKPDTRRFVIHHSDARNSYVSARLSTESPAGQATDLGNTDMGLVSAVQGFTSWAMANYPASHYAVDLWDHGSGWRPVGRQRTRSAGTGRGILYSDTFPAYIHNEQMATALTAPSPFDIVMMDACSMQMVEVAYQLRNVCTYTVSGEDASPVEGYPYHLALAPLLANANRTPAQVAQDIVEQYIAHPPADGPDLTQSAVITSQLPALVTAINSYAALLKAKDSQYHAAIVTARTNTTSYPGGDPADYEGVRDLVDFVNRVSAGTNDQQLIAAGNAVAAAVTQALLAEGHVGAETGSHGIAIYLPGNDTVRTTDAWSLLRSAYKLSDFATPSGWASWLDTFYGVSG